MKEKSFAEKLFKDYGNLNREGLVEVLDSIELVRKQMCFTAIVNFIKELHSKLSPSNTLFYTHKQQRFSNEEEWISEILKDRSWVGLEIALEKSDSDCFGLGIEFSSMDMDANVYYGIMSHGVLDLQVNILSPSNKFLSNWEKEGFSVTQNEYWLENIVIKNWVTSAICRMGYCANWEDLYEIKIVDHINLNWFVSDLKYYKSLSVIK